jgi:hypothetical protein
MRNVGGPINARGMTRKSCRNSPSNWVSARRTFIASYSAATLIASFGFKIHLLLFDPWFLKIGRLARFQKKVARN